MTEIVTRESLKTKNVESKTTGNVAKPSPKHLVKL